MSEYLIKNYFKLTNDKPMIQMRSESLAFIFKNTFGFDTLTVNGCFEEISAGGFAQATKTMAIENFNNNGISNKRLIFIQPKNRKIAKIIVTIFKSIFCEIFAG